MKIPIYQVDAFTSELFGGNPAAVCPLSNWLPDEQLQKIAAENNLSETAFFVKNDTGYELRWFTPGTEVNLCGHATLASAYVIFNHLSHPSDQIAFHSPRTGPLPVSRKAEKIVLDFPADPPAQVETTDEIQECFNVKPLSCFKGKEKLLVRFETEDQVKNLVPVFRKIVQLDAQGVIVTAIGSEVDFVSRFFAPRVGINEDPVTGSAHTVLTPYWAKNLGKSNLTAKQISTRGGDVSCEVIDDRVKLGGHAKLYLIGEIYI